MILNLSRNIFFIGISLSVLIGCVSQKKINKVKEERNQPLAEKVVQTKINPQVVAIQSQYLVKDSSSVKVFLELTVENLNATSFIEQLNEHFRISWLLQPDYGIRERLSFGKIEITPQNFGINNNKVSFQFDLQRPKNTTKALLLTEVFDISANKKLTNDLVIDFTGARLNDRFGIYTNPITAPIFSTFVNVGETFFLNSLVPTTKTLFLIPYLHEFEAAQSPMATVPRPAPKNIKMGSPLSVQANTPLKLDQEGLYLVVEDTATKANGFGIMIADKRFPRFTRAEKLLQPLIYMSTNLERKALEETTDPKQALDRHFLTLTGGNQGLAKKIIRTYYERIEEANRLFTTFKEGWKTDKGMVYIILGSPNKVQRSRDREVWMYAQTVNSSEIIFTFNRKPNQFTENHYELVRYPEYQAYWYPFVEAWRTGNVAE